MKREKWTENDIATLKAEYLKVKTKEDKIRLEILLKATWTQIVQKANYLKIKLRNWKQLASDIEIASMYQQGKTIKEIADFYGHSSPFITKILKKSNTKIRTVSETSRKYKFNENFFDNIDSEEKAYFLGLLYADGCNHSSKNGIYLQLQKKDKELMEKLNKIIFEDKNLLFFKSKNSNQQDSYRIQIHSNHMSRKLEELGCVPRKSLILTFPEWLDPKLYNHFIRGYFDGDGCISIGRGSNGKPYFIFSVCGTHRFIEKVQDILIDSLQLPKTKMAYKYKNNIITLTELRYSGKPKCQKIFQWMYKDSTIYMQRKYDKFLNLFD